MKHLNKDLKPLAEGEFPDRGAKLFGDDFGKRAKSMADNVRALLLGTMLAAIFAIHPAPFITGNFKTSNTEP